MNGRPGRFNLVDARSHRLGRVCRSTFGAELLSSGEGLDGGQYSRGALAELLGYPMEHRAAEKSAELVPLQWVTDARGNFDKCNSDAHTHVWQSEVIGFHEVRRERRTPLCRGQARRTCLRMVERS